MKLNNLILIIKIIIIIIVVVVVKSDLIEFDAVSTCTLQTPCDFNNVESWLGGDLPGRDDDVVIDYSNSNAREVYIYAKGLNSTYKSLTIKGHKTSDDKAHPHLILTDCTLNITNSLFIVRSAVFINQTSTLSAASATTTTNKINNIDINNKIKLLNNSAIYVYNNNNINSKSINVDSRSKVYFYNNSILQISGNSTFDNRPVFNDQSVFITFNEKNSNQHLSIFKNGLSSSIGSQISLGKSEFNGGETTVYNLIINDLISITNGANFTINNKFNMISSGGIFIDSSNSKLIISKTSLSNQKLNNIQLSNNGQIIINNPTIQVGKISGSGNIEFDSDQDPDANIQINQINQLNSSTINIGVGGNSNILINSSMINKLYNFESRLNQSNIYSNIGIIGSCQINQFNIMYTSQITIQDQHSKLIISNLNQNQNNLIEGTISNQGGELYLINSTLKSSIDSTGTMILNNSTLNGDIFLYGTETSGELNYTSTSTINGFLQLDDNSKTIINYNNINDQLIINGNLIINSNYFSIISNQDQNLNSLLIINGKISSSSKNNNNNNNKPSPIISLYFTSEPKVDKSYQLFKLSTISTSSKNQNQTLSLLLSSIIKPILITNTNHLNINTNLHLNSQYYYGGSGGDNNISIAYTKFGLPQVVKHMSGWEIFLIVISCIAVVVLVAAIIYAYSNHKRYIGYLPL